MSVTKMCFYLPQQDCYCNHIAHSSLLESASKSCQILAKIDIALSWPENLLGNLVYNHCYFDPDFSSLLVWFSLVYESSDLLVKFVLVEIGYVVPTKGQLISKRLFCKVYIFWEGHIFCEIFTLLLTGTT